jgi:hypothetical protein
VWKSTELYRNTHPQPPATPFSSLSIFEYPRCLK